MSLILRSGFEPGDFSEWTGTSAGVGVADTATVVASPDPVYAGIYACKFVTDGLLDSGVPGWDTIFAYLNLATAITEIYTRQYVRTGLICTVNKTLLALMISSLTPGNQILRVGWEGQIGGTNAWLLNYYADGAGVVDYLYSTLPTDIWQCLETYTKISDTKGEVRVRLDGLLLGNYSGFDNLTGSGNIEQISVGCGTTDPVPQTVYIDEVKFATQRIGRYTIPALRTTVNSP